MQKRISSKINWKYAYLFLVGIVVFLVLLRIVVSTSMYPKSATVIYKLYDREGTKTKKTHLLNPRIMRKKNWPSEKFKKINRLPFSSSYGESRVPLRDIDSIEVLGADFMGNSCRITLRNEKSIEGSLEFNRTFLIQGKVQDEYFSGVRSFDILKKLSAIYFHW